MSEARTWRTQAIDLDAAEQGNAAAQFRPAEFYRDGLALASSVF